MSRPILPDTDVLVDFLRGYEKAVAFVNDNASRIILSCIVIAELVPGSEGMPSKPPSIGLSPCSELFL